MKKTMFGIHLHFLNRYRLLLSALMLLGLPGMNVFADSQFLIEAGRSDNTLGQHKDWWVYTGGTFFQSSGNITPPGATPGIGSQFMTSTDASCELRPVMTTPGGTWLIEFAIPVTTLVEGTAVSITLTGCSGLPASVTNFSGGPANAWQTLGTITLDEGVTTPVIGIAWDLNNATPPGFSNRIYPCEFRFTPVGEPCQDVPPLSPVAGPLAEGQTYVDVPSVTNTASAVTVYADDGFGGAFAQIGQLTTGIVDGVNRVTTSALVKGAQVIATQTIGGQESCQAGAGPKVGGGANPRIRVNFLLNHDDTLTGPIGAPGNYAAGPSLHALGSSGPVSAGYLFAPAEGMVLNPSPCWQTVTFTGGFVDFEYQIFAGTAVTPGSFATLAGVAFSIDDTTDSGPFNIYIDNIVNGSTLIQDFESPLGSTTNYFFSPPRADATTRVYSLSAPNVSSIATNNADTGDKSSLISWQFGTESSAAWTMLLATGTNGLPQVDLTQPISIRFLVLPVGETTNTLQVSALGQRTAVTNENVSLNVSILRGTEPFTYQWRSNGVDIANETTASLTLNNVQVDASANYSVFVTDNTGCSTESFGSLTVTEVIPQPVLTFTRTGSNLELSWTDGNAVLQEATALTGSPSDWSDVLNPTNPYNVSTETGTKFFRLRR